MKLIIFKRKFYLFTILAGLFFIFTFMIPSCEAHVLIIADGDSSTPVLMTEAKNTAQALNSKGYKVLELYQKNATTKKIMKGLYNADAVIYLGHGGYIYGHYDNNGGTATSPFAMVGSDGFIWGINGKMREGWNGKLITAPYKSNIPVILAHACFSSGYVEDKEVSNPTETIYNFSQMFTGGGGNYYATGYFGYYNGKMVVDLVDEFLNGATSFNDANRKNTGKTITTYKTYNGQTIWRNNHGCVAFVGNWNAKFPLASQTTSYNDAAAEAWYQSVISGNTDITSPEIVYTYPSSYANGVSLTGPVTITFSENIIAGPNFSSIYIKNLRTGEKVTLASKITSGSVLTIKQSLNRSYGTGYQVYIPAGAVKDGFGNKLASAYSFIFKTVLDVTPPRVVRTSPVNYATGASLTEPITITFSEYVRASAYFSRIYIKNLKTGRKVAIASKIIRGNILYLKLSLNRVKNNLYQVYIPLAAVKDGSSNILKTSYSFRFRTIK